MMNRASCLLIASALLSACATATPSSPRDFISAKHGYYRLTHPSGVSVKVGQLADVKSGKLIHMTVQSNVPAVAFPVNKGAAADMQLAAHTANAGGILVVLKEAGFDFTAESGSGSSMTISGLTGESVENIAPLIDHLRGPAKNAVSPAFRDQIQAAGIEVVVEVVYASSYTLLETASGGFAVKILDPVVGGYGQTSASTETQRGGAAPLPVLFRTARLALPSLKCFEVPPSLTFRGADTYKTFQVGNQCPHPVRWWQDLSKPADVKLLPGGESLASRVVSGDIHVLRREGCQENTAIALMTDADSTPFFIPVTFERRCLSLKQLAEDADTRSAQVPAVNLERTATAAFYSGSYAAAYASARAAQKAAPTLKTDPSHQRLVAASKGMQRLTADLTTADVDILKGFSDAAFDIQQKDWRTASAKLESHQWERIAESAELQKAATTILRMLRPAASETEVRNVAVKASAFAAQY